MSKKSGKHDDLYSGEQMRFEDYFLDEDVNRSGEKEDVQDHKIMQRKSAQKPASAGQRKKHPQKNEAAPEKNRRKEQKNSSGEHEQRNGAKEASGKEKNKDVEVRSQEDMRKEDRKKSNKRETVSRKNSSGKAAPDGKKTEKETAAETKKDGAGKGGPEESGKVPTDGKRNNTGRLSSDPRRNGAEKDPLDARKGNAGKDRAGERGRDAQRNGSRRGSRRKQKQPAGSENRTKQKKNTGLKIFGIAAGVSLVIAAAVYLGISVFFMNHFYVNTKINGHEFSAKTVEDVKAYIRGQVEDYTLTILEKENKTDTISGKDIALKYEENKEIEKALEAQNAFLWPQAFFKKNSAEVTVKVSYEHEMLDNLINNLQAVTAEQLPPTSAFPKFDGTQFVVEPEVTGTAVDQDILRQKVKDFISEFRSELNMEEEGCYALPQYTSESVEVKDACNEMNKYLQASITYTMDEPVVVDRNLISNWVTADENMNVTFHEDAVRAWLAEFGQRYDTVGTTRTITSPQGRTVEVSGGTYGWGVDEDTEFVALINSIRNGEVITKDPAYCEGQTAASHGPQDWGSTYAEVDLAVQHMWYIVDGAVAMESDIVSGVPIPAKETTPGVFYILEKSLNKTLVGEIDPATGKPEYRTPVAFWMRITWSGIGFHDATWQPAFGGNLYASGYGSHGCVNMPYDAASNLYNMMPEFTPVIVHW